MERGGAPGMGGVRMGVKILCAQLAMADLQPKLKKCKFSCPCLQHRAESVVGSYLLDIC